MTGQIKSIHEKGYGFIRASDNREYFFHQSAVIGDFSRLKPGQKVEFVPNEGLKGPRAESVELK